jgi:hypothetical protein
MIWKAPSFLFPLIDQGRHVQYLNLELVRVDRFGIWCMGVLKSQPLSLGRPVSFRHGCLR